MKKLLLVMLVPVLVLGLFSCGKVMDGEKVISAMQGGWIDTNSQVAFTLTPNQAVVFKANYGLGLEYGTVAFRTEATGGLTEKEIKYTGLTGTAKATNDGFFDLGNTVQSDLKTDLDTNATYAGINDASKPYSGTIVFYDFEQGAKQKIGTIEVGFFLADPTAGVPPIVQDVVIVRKSTKEFAYQNYLIPPTGIYTRQ